MHRLVCPNLNHSRTDPPLRHCPRCGEVVNGNIPARICTEEEHAETRRSMIKFRFCVHCGELLGN